MRHAGAVLAVVLAMVGGLVGLGTVAGAPHAAACDGHEPECRDDEPDRSALVLSGTFVAGTDVFTIEARSDGGMVSGRVDVLDSPDQGGPVLEVVERGGDEYCVLVDAVANVPPSRIAYYVRDVGNGVTSFDQYTSLGSTTPITCDSFDPQPSDFSTVTAGDIRVR